MWPDGRRVQKQIALSYVADGIDFTSYGSAIAVSERDWTVRPIIGQPETYTENDEPRGRIYRKE